jgi:hypothetical protein
MNYAPHYDAEEVSWYFGTRCPKRGAPGPLPGQYPERGHGKAEFSNALFILVKVVHGYITWGTLH